MKIQIIPPVAILGYGIEGRFAFEFLRGQKIFDVTICDENESIMLPKRAKKHLGSQAFANLFNFRTIIRSPGVRFELPGIKEAARTGSKIISLTRLTLELAAGRLTAISGSNGKTTTSRLTAEILRAHYGDKFIFGGNDGAPTLKEAIDHPDYPILMEVSSFQFADLAISPHISALLNITTNHLDWHEDLEDYIRAKSNLFRHQNAGDWAVLNANNQNSAKMADSTAAQIFWIGKQKGKSWAKWDGPWLTIRHEGKTRRVISRNTLLFKTHPDNLLFAAAIAILHGVPTGTVKEQMKRFPGVPHRLEYIRTLKDVRFYNDSSCTTPESAMVTIDLFDPRHLILLLGGSSKKADFSFLAAKIKEKNARVYLYGKEGERIRDALTEAGAQNLILAYNTSGDFRQIVRNAYSFAQPEDTIVLSPACASFDMFPNAKERGYQFTDIVKSLEGGSRTNHRLHDRKL